jgi:hypothetical protein
MAKIKIYNLQDYALECKYIVYRINREGERWFYGGYNNVSQAANVAAEIGGFVCERGEIDA